MADEYGTVTMTEETNERRSPLRRIACARCGTGFECGAGGNRCWCADEAYRMPMPAAGEDCLCPACLRMAARDNAAGRRA
jgi:hypothetical protein